MKYLPECISPSEVVGLSEAVQCGEVLGVDPNLEVWAGIQAAVMVEEVEPTHWPMGRVNLEGRGHA